MLCRVNAKLTLEGFLHAATKICNHADMVHILTGCSDPYLSLLILAIHVHSLLTMSPAYMLVLV